MLTGNSRITCAVTFLRGIFLRGTFMGATCLSVVLAGSLFAADGATTESSTLPDHLLVVRFSDSFLNSVMDDKDFDRQTDVRDVILGTSVSGKARIVGKPGVKFLESDDDASFYITFNGSVYSRTIGYNRGVTIRSHTITNFTAWRRVAFKPGEGFYVLPPKVSTRTETFIDGISAGRGGLIGRVIVRRAQRIEAAQHAEAREIVRQRTQRQIEVAFDRSSEYRLARLNKVADYRYIAAAALKSSGSEDPKYACCTTRQYLQIAAKPNGSGTAIQLPATDAAGGAPIELWVHESVSENPITWATALFAQRFHGLRDLPTLVRSLLGDQLRTRQVEGWQVVQLDKSNDAVTATRQIATRQVASREVASREVASREVASREVAPREVAPREVAPREVAPREVASAVPPPPPTTRRIWTSGQYTADAEFIALQGNIVRLKRNTGINTSIPFDLLSVADQTWIRNHLKTR